MPAAHVIGQEVVSAPLPKHPALSFEQVAAPPADQVPGAQGMGHSRVSPPVPEQPGLSFEQLAAPPVE